MGLYEFCCKPFGLSGALRSFQRLMDKVLCGLPFVVIHLDDILIYSTDVNQHPDHLHQVFSGLQAAGLTLRGNKYHIGLHSVSYLGHNFSAEGMAPDPKKTKQSGNGPHQVVSKLYVNFWGLLHTTEVTLRILPTLQVLYTS